MVKQESLMSVFSAVVWGLAGSCLALALVLQSGYSVGAAGLLLLSLATPFLGAYRSTSHERLLVATLGGYFCLMVLFVYLDGWHYRELDRPLRFILAIPVLLLLSRCPGPRVLLWVGSILGAYGAFSFAIYDRFVLGKPRAEGLDMAVTFGNVAMLLGFLSAAAALYYISQRRYLWLTLALIGFVLGVMASLLSGTRGGWLVLPPLLLFLGWHSRGLLGSKTMTALALIILLGGIVILNSPQLGVADRLWAAFTGVHNYWQGKPDLSVGGRLEMWRANLQFFTSSPLFGVGEYQGMALKTALAEAGMMSEVAASYSHAHNEYIDALGLRGLVGFTALLAVYLVPLCLFVAKLGSSHRGWRVRSYALAGALIPLSYMIFALTDAMFSNNIGVMLYVFPIAFFWAAVQREETFEDQTLRAVGE